MISYDNNATTTTTIAMRIEEERRAEQQKVDWGRRKGKGEEVWSWAERKRLLGDRSRCYSRTHTHTHAGEGLGLGLSLSLEIFPVRVSLRTARHKMLLLNK